MDWMVDSDAGSVKAFGSACSCLRREGLLTITIIGVHYRGMKDDRSGKDPDHEPCLVARIGLHFGGVGLPDLGN